MFKINVNLIEEAVGYHFVNRDLAVSAFTHPSAVEGKPRGASYERLEFLGDSVLGAIVSYDLYVSYPELTEGDLSRIKTALVAGETLSLVADGLGFARLIRFGASAHGTGARGIRSALENVYEATVGAIYLDGGYESAHEFVSRTLGPHMSRDLARHAESAKSLLQQVTQRQHRGTPTYSLVGKEGPAHEPVYTAVVKVGGTRIGRGTGQSKKEAEKSAALDALERMGMEL